MPPTRNGHPFLPTSPLSRRQILVTGALALTATALPAASARAAGGRTDGDYAGYLFVYFTGEGTSTGEQIYMALSRGDDPVHFRELNAAAPVLTSDLGDKGVRDPFIIRSPEGDKFFLIATDLKINGGASWDYVQRHGSRSIIVWESSDLVTWDGPRSVQVSPETAGNTWAPEAYWSEELGEYVVFWASKLYEASDTGHTADTYNRMLYCTTKDFRTFSEAKVWNDPGYSVIDSTVIAHAGTYYRFTKDERSASQSPYGKFILEEKATDLLAADWDTVAEGIGMGSMAQGEGPLVFKSNTENKWYLFIDDYTNTGYMPFVSDDLAGGTWTEVERRRLPAAPRHGTVLPVTAAEFERLRAKWAVPAVRAGKDGLVAHWPLADDAKDTSGHGYHGTAAGDAAFSDRALVLGGTDGHVKLPDDMLAGLDTVTVAADVWVDTDQATPYFLFGFGNTAASTGYGNGYLFATGGSADSGFRAALSDGNWKREAGTESHTGLSRGRWAHVTYTLDGSGTARLYLDGAVVATNTAVDLTPGDIGGGHTTANYLGRSQYTGDKRLKGRLRDVRLYNRALSDDEIAALPENATRIRGVELDSLKVPAIIEGEGGTVVLPVVPGTQLRSLKPRFSLAPGARMSPANGRRIDLRRPVTYTVTSASGERRTWKVSAVEMRTPVLPKYHADPNIVAFGDTYYLYTTTDGFDGWSGTTFSVWSSKNLVDWTDRGVILDLGKDVSWAESRAWAPTIAERDGTYFFYYCAEAKIGVATADSPVGPFTDSGKVLIAANPSGGGQAIDPAVFTDDDGQAYLYWGNGSAWVVPLGDDMVSYDASKAKRITGLDDFREGMFVVKRKGMYHLTYSIDDTRSANYRVGYATSDSPYGPFTSHGVILEKDPAQGILGTGHNSLLQVPGTDEWYTAYHRFAIPGGDGTHRETTIDRVEFGTDGLLKPVTPTLDGVRPRRIPGS
ncbi:family 43 glycosylhydrolase [Streptomyces sp. VRA16 Mangrove soil]|uniref:family 43 glycosylhydrolase n=1 Tax=Streptomyces sp. VRA16 Mangrove soil TaxID=2817434 RepID=UPI001A9D8D21|nr:family 43 glycosylhydrolase [Streptomyces sp. VRA16 Mangrove soil]MBO1334729.1 family 43 glycosylhydrolase [Streptomyces sp. VRA16 Mangrove soil]